jgi:hypothetical protein
MTNCKGYGRELSWPHLRYYPGIYVKGLRKTTKISIRITDLGAEI